MSPLSSYRQELFAVSLTALTLLIPVFFIILRLTAFGTLPFDNYHDPVLHLAGSMPDFRPYSPTCYRFLYIYTGYFFYLVMPEVTLSRLPVLSIPAEQYAALQGLAAASFLYLYGFAILLYHHLRRSQRLSVSQAVAFSLTACLLSFQMAYYGADTAYLFYAMLLLHFHQQKSSLFGPFLLLSFLVNEKIGLVSLAFWGLQFLFQAERKPHLAGIGFSLGSMLLYFAMRTVLSYPGYGHQTDISALPERLALCWHHLYSYKGLYVNMLPLTILLTPGLYLLSRKGITARQIWPVVLLPIFTFALGCFACSDYTIGRIALHALPFLVAPVAGQIRMQGIQPALPTRT